MENDGQFASLPTDTFQFNTSFHNVPTITAFTPNTTTVNVAENGSQAFTLTATDLDNDVPFTYTWTVDGVTVQSGVGSSFTYAPSFDAAGTHTLVGTVADTTNSNVSRSWSVVVANTNRAPVLATIPALTATEDASFTFNVSAVDPDSDAVTFVSNLSNVTFTTVKTGNTTNGTATWTPTNNDVGTRIVNITASDGTLQATQLVTVTVQNTNDAPVITGFSPADTTPKLAADKSRTFELNASDVDAGTTLTTTWNVNSTVGGTGTAFTYTANNNPGTFNITATVSDGTVSLKQSWLLKVSALPVSDTLGGSITQLSQAELSAATNVTIESNVSGGINFGNEVLNLTGIVDLDDVVQVAPGVVAIDTSKAPQLNKPAKLTMKGLGLASQPVIFYNPGFGVSGNTVCPSTICKNVQYSSGTLTFDVTGFSTFFVTGNLAPIANAGADSNVQTQDAVTLDGSGSRDPDNNPLTYAWSQVAGPNVTLSNPTAVKSTFIPPQDATYIFQLVVNDGVVNSMPDNVTVESLGGILDVMRVRLNSVDKDDKLKPGEALEVEVDIKNRGEIDMENVEMKIWFEDSSGRKLEDDDNDEIEDDSEFDLDAGDDEGDLDDEDVTFTFEMPFDVDDGDKYIVVVEAVGEQSNDSSVKYRDIDRSETIEFEKEKHEVEISRAAATPSTVSCRRSVTLDVSVRNIGEKEEDVQLTILNTGLGVSLSDSFQLDNDASDNDNIEQRSFLFTVKDDVVEGFYPLSVVASFNDGRDTASENINLQVNDCVTQKTTDVTEPVTVVTKEPTTPTPATPKEPVTKVSFSETDEYLLALGLGVVILTGLVIFAFGAVAVSLRRR